MIYVTGDVHGDLARFSKNKEIKKLKKGDTLLVCGDFGFVWDGSKKERKTIAWLAARPYRILFVEGTHDNLDLLARYPLEEFACAPARRLGKNLYHLQRGEVYTVEGRRIFTFGGGESTDLDQRVPGVSWWEGEQPAARELEAARRKLAEYGHEVDYIVTHECSSALMSFIGLKDDSLERITPLNAFFGEVEKNCRFRNWYFGCYHLDKRVSGSYTAVFKSIVPIER